MLVLVQLACRRVLEHVTRCEWIDGWMDDSSVGSCTGQRWAVDALEAHEGRAKRGLVAGLDGFEARHIEVPQFNDAPADLAEDAHGSPPVQIDSKLSARGLVLEPVENNHSRRQHQIFARRAIGIRAHDPATLGAKTADCKGLRTLGLTSRIETRRASRVHAEANTLMRAREAILAARREKVCVHLEP